MFKRKKSSLSDYNEESKICGHVFHSWSWNEMHLFIRLVHHRPSAFLFNAKERKDDRQYKTKNQNALFVATHSLSMTKQVTASAAMTFAVLMSSLEKQKKSTFVSYSTQPINQFTSLFNLYSSSELRMTAGHQPKLNTCTGIQAVTSYSAPFALHNGNIISTGNTQHCVTGITLYRIWHQLHPPLTMMLLQRSRPSRTNPLSLYPKNPSFTVKKIIFTQSPTAISCNSEPAQRPGQPSNKRHACGTCI